MKPKLSIIIPTYNRIEMLKTLIGSIQNKLGDYSYEIIVSDDASMDGTQEYFTTNNNSKIVYVRSSINQGAFKNILQGYRNASSDLVWTVADDDNIGDEKFILDGIELMSSGNADVVFGRMSVKQGAIEEIKNYKFKDEYTSDEFINDWFEIIDHLCFSSFIFKRSILLDSFPDLDAGHFGNTLDYAIIYQIIKKSKKISFLDKVAYIWTKSVSTSMSGNARADLLLNAIHLFAFPISNFSKTKDYDIKFFNKYIIRAVDILLSNYYIDSNELYFAKIIDWYRSNNIEKLYIYGKGEVGIMLMQYLQENNIKIESFVDDVVDNTDCIRFDKFLETKNSLYVNGVVIASYKCDVAMKIYAKLNSCIGDNINIISLHAVSRRENV